MTIHDSGVLYDAEVASGAEWASTDFRAPRHSVNVAITVFADRGGTFDLDEWLGGEDGGGFEQIDTSAIAAATATPISYARRIGRGRVRFTPTDATLGRTRIQVNFGRGE